MDTLLFDSLREFVKPYYADKNDFHNLEHVRRIIEGARALGRDQRLDDDLLVFGAYLHGLIFNAESEIRDFLFSIGLDRDQVIGIMKVAWESGKETTPETPEGVCLRDAHLVEGGREYQTAKWLISAAAQGQSLPQIIDFFETRLIGKYACGLPQARQNHADIEDFRRQFIASVKAALANPSKRTA